VAGLLLFNPQNYWLTVSHRGIISLVVLFVEWFQPKKMNTNTLDSQRPSWFPSGNGPFAELETNSGVGEFFHPKHVIPAKEAVSQSAKLHILLFLSFRAWPGIQYFFKVLRYWMPDPSSRTWSGTGMTGKI
jgi:hypothetical protein